MRFTLEKSSPIIIIEPLWAPFMHPMTGTRYSLCLISMNPGNGPGEAIKQIKKLKAMTLAQQRGGIIVREVHSAETFICGIPSPYGIAETKIKCINLNK